MNRNLRRVLVAVCMVCGLFMTAYLARAAATRSAPSPTAPPLSLEQFQMLGTPQAPAPRPDGSGPRLTVQEKDHDFGVVLQGEKVRHVFVIRNEGTETAHIQNVRSSCGCTATVLSSKEVPPGGTTEVAAEFSAGAARGSFHKKVRVLSDDPSSPLVLGVAGKVVPLFRVEPEITLFGRLEPGQTAKRQIRIVGAKPEVRFAGGPPRATNLDIEVGEAKPVAGEPSTWTLDLTAQPKDARSNLTGLLLLPTGDNSAPYVNVRVAGEVEGAP